jgi:hypothetical protein
MPEHAHWAIYEVEQLHPEYKLHEEPARFMCLGYHNIGQMVLPEDLEGYQPLLDQFNKNTGLVPKIKEAWEKYKDLPIESLDQDSIIHWQLLLLHSDQQYMDWKKKLYLSDLEFYK